MTTTETADGREAVLADGLMTIEEAGMYLRLSRSTIYELMDSGQLAYVRLGRCRRIPRRALVALAAGGLVGA